MALERRAKPVPVEKNEERNRRERGAEEDRALAARREPQEAFLVPAAGALEVLRCFFVCFSTRAVSLSAFFFLRRVVSMRE